MFGLLKSVIDVAADLATVAVAPVEIAVDLVNAAVKPVAEVAEELVRDVKILKE